MITRTATAATVFTLLGISLGPVVHAAPFFQVATNTATANSNSYPATEGPNNVRDASNSNKYLNFGKEETGVIETFPTAQTVNGITFTVANDGPERDPMTFSIYGSNSTLVAGSEAAGTLFDLGSGFTLIAANQTIAGMVGGPPVRGTVLANDAFANATAYRTYAVVFPTLRNTVTANSMQIADIIFTNGGTPLAGQATNPVIGGDLVVPEPASLGLLGIAGLILTARRPRRT